MPSCARLPSKGHRSARPRRTRGRARHQEAVGSPRCPWLPPPPTAAVRARILRQVDALDNLGWDIVLGGGLGLDPLGLPLGRVKRDPRVPLSDHPTRALFPPFIPTP